MLRQTTLGIGICLALGLGCAPADREDKVIMVADDDPEMQQAIASARARLTEFWSAFESRKNGESNFALKVEMTDPNGTEFFWATDLDRREGKTFGTINNDPNIVKSVSFGQEVEIPEEKVCDWLYIRGGKMHGNLTLRPLLKPMPKDKADVLRARLAEP